MSMLTSSIVILAMTACVASTMSQFKQDEPVTRFNAPPIIPIPTGPASRLPNLDGTGYPEYRIVFEQGECTADDFPKKVGDSRINMNKTCFSCFRIPTLLGGQTPGVVHAFAEARRAELFAHFHQYTFSGMGSCPDGPDTRLAYKRSTDNGASWSPIKIFVQHKGDPHFRAENGECQSQAAPFIDPSTKTLFVAFNQHASGCVGDSKPMLVNSTDDGLTWSDAYPMMLNGGPGRPPISVGKPGYMVGPTKGLTVKSPTGDTRLTIPGEWKWSASVYSDDHGQTWNSNANNRNMSLSPGEMDWTPCVPGTSCPNGARFVMLNRAALNGPVRAIGNPGVSYSHDGTTWSRQMPTDSGDLVVGLGHAKPGVVAVAPGAFILSTTIDLCKKGIKANPDMSCGIPGSTNYTKRQPSDVLGHGMGLLISKDGTNWTLFKKMWPISGMYSTAAALSINAEGAALSYGIIFAGGSLPTSGTGTIYFMNFTAVHANGTVDSELAAAIAKLDQGIAETIIV